MTVCSESNKNFSFTAQHSRYKKIAIIRLSRSQQTIKIIGLDGELLGLARCEELIELLNDNLSHVDVVLYDSNPEATQ